MYSYSAYGLGIRSELRMPELRERPVRPEVSVRYAPLRRPAGRSEGNGPCVEVRGDEIVLYWKEVGTVAVKGGRAVLLDPAEAVEPGLLRHIVQGIAFGLLLHQRGVFTLHASAVEVGDGVVAFVGWKGWGKSTTAAAFHARGHGLVTDDVLALEMPADGSSPVVLPGFPVLKLWPDALRASFGMPTGNLPKIYGPSPKRVWSSGGAAGGAARPLRALYVLGYAPAGESGPLVETVPLTLREAAVWMVRHSYALRFLGRHAASAGHLEACAALARRVPVHRLVRRPSLDRLDVLVDLVTSGAGAVPHTPTPCGHGRGS